MNRYPPQRRKKKKGIPPIVPYAAAVILAGALIATVIIKNNAYNDYVAASNETIEELDSAGDELSTQLERLRTEKTALEGQLAAVESEKAELIESFGDSDSLYKQLNDKYNTMSGQLNARIAELEENIKKLETVYLVDINAQFDILNELETLLANPVKHVIVTETENPDGSITETESEGVPAIALYYHDLVNGYTYSYNADATMNPASMIKAPFILSLLMAASDEEAAIAASGVEKERKYDMTKKITYTEEEYFQPGSGEIVQGKDGDEYTYRDLFYHVLECSDNVAYAILKDEYGNKPYSALIQKIGAKTLLQNKMVMSAADAGKVMEAIYEFTESDAYYASFMKDAMIDSRHLVMIPFAVKPYETAHKYGWDVDSYCDMGIVYADSPYVVAIMTNYDEGGDEVNTYIRSILSLINRMHDNFYRQR